MASAASIANTILGEAVKTGGQTWTKIASATKIFVRGYAQTLTDIAKGVAVGDISAAEAKQFAKNATFLLSQSIANMAQIVLHRVQSFINKVLSAVKGVINTALGIPLL